MTRAELSSLIAGIAPVLKLKIAEAVDKGVAARIGPLEGRLESLERSGVAVHYEGIFDAARQYTTGSLAARAGSLWLALKTTTGETPGAAPDAWLLVVKQGRA